MTDLVGVVVVTYNSEGFLTPCLKAAVKLGPVVVVDNASADRTVSIARTFDGVRVIANVANLGFAAAANQGFRLLSTPLVLLLNPDAIVATPLQPLIEACAADDIGAATGKLVHPTGAPQFGFTLRRFPTVWTLLFELLGVNRLWPGNPFNRRYRCADLDLNRAQPVEQPAGAFLLIKRAVWQQLGGFDERFYPLWFEDVDFLQRMHSLGLKVWYSPRVWAIHHGGHSLARLAPVERHKYWYDSLLQYAGKHFKGWQVRLLAVAVVVGAFGRIVTGFASGRGLGEQFTAAIGIAGKVLRTGPKTDVGHPEVDIKRKHTKVRNRQSHGQ